MAAPRTHPRLDDPDDAATRVVLVEDDDDLREGLAENLRLNGMSVTEAGSGVAFRNALGADTFDVAIVDVNLPDASGFDLARAVAQAAEPPGVILLTARTGREDRVQGYAEGADLYMTKPVDSEELVLAVRNLARRVRGTRPIAPAAPAAARPWRLDVQGARLFAADGTVIALSGREVLLLQQFVDAGGHPVSRSTLGRVMGYGEPGPTRRGLDAALRRLREKAAARGVVMPFQIVHAIGIRFTAELVLA